MGLRMWIGSIAVMVMVPALAITQAVSAETTHTYSVSLTIAVDRATGKIGGVIVTEAPSEFCDSSTVRVRKAMAGKGKVVARIHPVYGEWHWKPPALLRGQRVYVEVLPYHLPSRPVECLGARSRTVTAP